MPSEPSDASSRLDRLAAAIVGAEGAAVTELTLVIDIDGTLSTLQPVPSAAQLVPGALDQLISLSAQTQVIVLSGRSITTLRSQFGLGDERLELLGSYGAERQHPASLTPPEAERLDAVVEAWRPLLAEPAAAGALIERKQISVAFHVRRCPPSEQARLLDDARRRAEQFAAGDHGVNVLLGLDTCEASARHSTKAATVRSLVASAPERRYVVIGDDHADLRAMEELRSGDVAIRVGRPGGPLAGELADPHEVVELLARVVDQLDPVPSDAAL